ADAEFRQRLIDNPGAAISSELGITLPSRLKLQVLEETDTNLYLVLPAAQVQTLDEAELAAVVGGAQEAQTQGAGNQISNKNKFGLVFTGSDTDTTSEAKNQA